MFFASKSACAMRVRAVAAWVFVAAIASAAGSARAELVGFYPFENGSANDASGNNRHGTILGATATASGYEGGAFDFDGDDEGINLPIDINPASMNAVTMGAWANADAANALRAVMTHDDGGWDRGINIDDRDPAYTGFAYSAFRGDPGPTEGDNLLSAGPDPAPVNQWVFVAARYDAPSGIVTLDVDGSRLTASANPGTGLPTLRVGRNPTFPEFFDGRIDNVFVYNTFLSDAEIDRIRAGGAGAIIPEPAGLAVVMSGLGALLIRRRRRVM